MNSNFDFLIVGGGIVGLTIALALNQNKAGTIGILEKEPDLGAHGSGRNSGVLHSGIYYPTDSIKAKVCAIGNQRLKDYAAERGIKVVNAGKVVVATSEEELPDLQKIFDRALTNGISVQKLTLQELKEVEPEAFSCQWALYSPSTAIIDPKQVLQALEKDLQSCDVKLFKKCEFVEVDSAQKIVSTSLGKIGYGHLINAAGLHADKIAHLMEVGKEFTIMPFRGAYWGLSSRAASRIRGLIYPVPNLSLPFLGMHITPLVSGSVVLGPTAFPALGRENYKGLGGLSPLETSRIGFNLFKMFALNQSGLRDLAFSELPMLSRHGFWKAAQKLAPFIEKEDIIPSPKVGLRAQLIDRHTKKLITDFKIEDGPDSTHILNAISPAFTGCMAFADLVLKHLAQKKVLS